MRLLSIELAGCKRLMWNQAAIFKMDLTQVIQLILGGNGSGKSTLMMELSPLPANGAMFNRGGYKTIRISHRNNLYELKNDFSTSNKGSHSFLKNDVELNKSRLQTSQIDLCWQEFGVNDDIRKLILGKQGMKFSQMKPTPRRQWFTLLADTNFDYALSRYQMLKEKNRDTVGALRKARERLVAETSKIITQEEQDRLKLEVEAIHRELSELDDLKAPVEHNLQRLEAQQASGLAELNQMTLRLLRTRHVAPFTAYGADELTRNDWGELEAPHFKSIASIDAYLARLKERAAAEEALINQAAKDHHKLTETLVILKKTGEEGIQSLTQKLADFRLQRDQLLTSRKLKLEGLEVHSARISLESCQEALFSVFSEIPENDDKRFNQAALKTLQENLATRRTIVLQYKNHVDKLSAQQTHLESHHGTESVECPKCFTKFKPGFSELQLKEVKEKVQAAVAKLKEEEAQVKTLEEKLEEFTNYGNLYRQYTACVKGYPALRAFWDYLDQEELPVRAPRMILALLTTFKRDLDIEAQAKQVETQIQELQVLISQAASLGNASLTETQTQLNEITLTVEAMTVHLNRIRLRHSEHVEYRRSLNEAIELGKKIDLLASNLTTLTADMVETMRREAIDHCIRQLRSQLGKKEDALTMVNQQLVLVKDLEGQIALLTTEEQALKLVTDALSPTDGLIAEGLLGFIKSFTKQMNQLIKKIWTYPLVVKPCGVSRESGVELDYKFPMMVLTADNVIDDVSEGSTGQQEVVDLAFVTTAMKYLGLSESPLFLDEPAPGLDATHKANFIVAIKSLLETQHFTQLFLISHDFHQYGALANAEVCVLDAKNIVVPETYNRHVTLH